MSFVLVAKRRLTFLNKEGFDRFGRNELFAPLMKWDALKKRMKTMIDRAQSYEDSYNQIKASIQDEISSLKNALPKATLTQVSSEKDRVVEARRVAISQKKTWVAVSKNVRRQITPITFLKTLAYVFFFFLLGEFGGQFLHSSYKYPVSISQRFWWPAGLPKIA